MYRQLKSLHVCAKEDNKEEPSWNSNKDPHRHVCVHSRQKCSWIIISRKDRREGRLEMHKAPVWDSGITSSLVLGGLMLESYVKVVRWGQVTSSSLSQPWQFCDPISTGMNSPQGNILYGKYGKSSAGARGFKVHIQSPAPHCRFNRKNCPSTPLPKITVWCYWWGMVGVFQLGAFQSG